jgi:hypothetical protein
LGGVTAFVLQVLLSALNLITAVVDWSLSHFKDDRPEDPSEETAPEPAWWRHHRWWRRTLPPAMVLLVITTFAAGIAAHIDARDEKHEAEKKAATLHEALRADNETLRSDVLRLEGKLDPFLALARPRPQLDALIRDLSRVRGQRMVVESDNGDMEARVYRGEIAEVFKRAGWSVEKSGALGGLEAPNFVGLAIRFGGEHPPYLAVELQAIFTARGMSTQLIRVPNWEIGRVTVSVGPKPRQ